MTYFERIVLPSVEMKKKQSYSLIEAVQILDVPITSVKQSEKVKELKKVDSISDSIFPLEVMEIQNWLSEEFYRISISDEEDNIYNIKALGEQDDDFYELNFEYHCIRTTVLLTIHCLKEINPEKYHFCMELLNYLNIHNAEVKFSLNPETMNLSCSQTIGFARWEANSDELTNRLDIYTFGSLDDLTKISRVLEENIGIVEAVRRTTGETIVFLKSQ